MKHLILTIFSSLLFLGNILAGSNVPKVPASMTFAGLELKLNSAAQNKIQKHVNDLRYSEKYFQAMVDKADIYFPIIEQAFQEEGFPDDFKYLIIQESAFKADAVSSSNAVGYWQFKGPTAKEIGLRVDNKVDERKNLEAASKAAARYITKNNKKLQNWVYALISYNTGLGGVMKYYKMKDKGVKRMNITQKTHWYALKLLAHKIAYQGSIHKKNPEISLTHTLATNTNLKHLAKKHNIKLDLLAKYNRWISTGRTIPTDREYSVVLPLPYTEKVKEEPIASTTPTEKTQPDSTEEIEVETSNDSENNPNEIEEDVEEGEEKKKQPIKVVTKVGNKEIETTLDELKERFKINRPITINGVPGVTAKNGDTPQRLALFGGISKNKFLKFNEIQSFEKIIPGQTYYFKRKKNKAKASFHEVKEGESIWEISQKHAINEWAIRSKNRMRDNEALKIGRVLWLKKYRPETTPIEYKNNKKTQKISSSKTHTVTKGDTLYSLSRKYDVTVEEIKKLNNLSGNNLSVGSVLIIK